MQAAKETQLGVSFSSFEPTLNQKIGRQHIPQVRASSAALQMVCGWELFSLLSSIRPARVKAARFLCDQKHWFSCGGMPATMGFSGLPAFKSVVLPGKSSTLGDGQAHRPSQLLPRSCVPVRLTQLGARSSRWLGPCQPLLLTRLGQRQTPSSWLLLPLPRPLHRCLQPRQGGFTHLLPGCVQLPRAPAWHPGTVASWPGAAPAL